MVGSISFKKNTNIKYSKKKPEYLCNKKYAARIFLSMQSLQSLIVVKEDPSVAIWTISFFGTFLLDLWNKQHTLIMIFVAGGANTCLKG